MLFNRFAVRDGVDSCICRHAVVWLSRLYDHSVCLCACIYTLALQVFSFHVSVCRCLVCISISVPPRAAKQGTLWEPASNTIPFGIVFFGGGRLAASALTPHGRTSTVSGRRLGHKRWAGCQPPLWQHLLLGVGGQGGWGCAAVLSYYG